MSETFDPDAWPFPHGGNAGAGGPTPPRTANGSSSSRPADAPGSPDDGRRQYEDEFESLRGGSSTTTDDDFDDFGYDQDGSGSGAPTGYDTYGGGTGEDEFANLRGERDPYQDDDFGAGRTGRDNGFESGGDYDDDYDDSYADDDYGREPTSEGGIRRKLLPIFVGLMFLLAGIFAFASFGGGDDKPSNGAPANPATTSPNATAAPKAPTQAPADVTQALNEAFVAWGKFAVDGNLEGVRPFFVNDGDQFNTFQTEASTIKANPPGGGPLEMRLANPEVLKNNNNSWKLKGVVTVGRSGENPDQYPWEITMTRGSDRDRWQVLEVRQY